MLTSSDILGFCRSHMDGRELYGVEIEFESADNLGSVPSGWEFHEDHSLRGGGEIVTLGAYPLNEVVSMVERACSVLKEAKTTHSTRTSFHVHMNVRGLCPQRLHYLIQLLIAVDPVLFAMTSPEREHNNFSLGQVYCGESTARLLAAMSFVRFYEDECGAIAHSLRPVSGQLNIFRYGSINLAPLSKFGSIELRHAAGDHDPTKFLTYLRKISQIRNTVLGFEYDHKKTMTGLASGEGIPCLEDVWDGLDSVQKASVETTTESALLADLPMDWLGPDFESAMDIMEYIAQNFKEPAVRGGGRACGSHG